MKQVEHGQMMQKIETLIPTYLPEWNYNPARPDSGTALAQLVGDMLGESDQRLQQVLHKHKISYLNLFDKLKAEPIEAATSFVQFSPVVGAPAPVHVPPHTGLSAQSDTTDKEIIFETTHGITATQTQLACVYSVDGAKDALCQLFPMPSGATTAQQARFSAFDTTQQNHSCHKLTLAFQDLLDGMQSFLVGLRLCTADPKDAPLAAQAMLAAKVQFSVQDPVLGSVPIAHVTAKGDTIYLSKEGFLPQRVPHGGKDLFVIELTAPAVLPIAVSSIELCMQQTQLPPDAVWCAGIEQLTQEIKPFGAPMGIYAECGIESRAVFAKKGASVQMSFDLSFDVIEQKLPTYEENLNFKLIMKKPPVLPSMVAYDIYADYVLIEYLSAQGWKRLLRDEKDALLFNTSVQGGVTLCFDCPADIVPPEQAPAGYRLRLRLLQADHLYQLPCKQYCPVLQNIRFSYETISKTITPHRALLQQNFETADVTTQFANRRTVQLFAGEAEQRPCMYFGFTAPPVGTPFSLYFGIENHGDAQVQMQIEYLGATGFAPAKVVDNTSGLRYSGTLLLLIPPSCVKKELFGQNCYWLRMVKQPDPAHHLQAAQPQYLAARQVAAPCITGVYLNMAQVENRSTHTKYYYIEDPYASFKIDLGEGDLTHAKVWVNEEGGAPDAEHWVQWHAQETPHDLGRVYQIDLAIGTIQFERGAFAATPVRKNASSVKVQYQSYMGSSANVPQGAICALRGTLPYIATVTNPIAAFGGYDGYNEDTAARMTASLLRTRNRAVTHADYWDIIQSATHEVRRMKALSGVDQYGQPSPDSITIALLINQYDMGGYVFSGIQSKVRTQIERCSGIQPLGKSLALIQPHFLPFSVKLWLETADIAHAYDLQQRVDALICLFLNPLDGGFEGQGWQIGEIPTRQQLLAYLGVKCPVLQVKTLAITVQYGTQEYSVDDFLQEKQKAPFAMAVNGKHNIYIDLKVP